MVVCVVLDLSLPPDLKFEASGTDKIKKNEIIRGVNSCMLPSFFAQINNCRRHLSRLLRLCLCVTKTCLTFFHFANQLKLNQLCMLIKPIKRQLPSILYGFLLTFANARESNGKLKTYHIQYTYWLNAQLCKVIYLIFNLSIAFNILMKEYRIKYNCLAFVANVAVAFANVRVQQGQVQICTYIL